IDKPIGDRGLTMIRNILLITAMLACSVAAAVEAGDEAPRFRAYDFSGRTVEFPAADGASASVVIFWATWCGYCKAFMPYLERIEADYRDRGVEVVTINAKEDGSGNPAEYISALGFPMTAIRSGDPIARSWGVEFIPGVFVVDSSGTISFRRPWTDLPAGQEVAELWDSQVRNALDDTLNP
ncbi:MAG: TlpA disulfide reductase family protein, partial [Gammaproteobacteria bacterium]